MCTIATRARVRLPRPQTAVSLKATNCSRFHINAQAFLHEFICAHWFLRGSLLTIRPAVFRLGNQQKQSPNVCASQTWEVDAQEQSGRARSLLIQASGRPAATSSSRPSQNFPIPARQRSLVGLSRQLPNSRCRQRSWWSGALQLDCRCHRDGYQAQWCECLSK